MTGSAPALARAISTHPYLRGHCRRACDDGCEPRGPCCSWTVPRLCHNCRFWTVPQLGTAWSNCMNPLQVRAWANRIDSHTLEVYSPYMPSPYVPSPYMPPGNTVSYMSSVGMSAASVTLLTSSTAAAGTGVSSGAGVGDGAAGATALGARGTGATGNGGGTGADAADVAGSGGASGSVEGKSEGICRPGAMPRAWVEVARGGAVASGAGSSARRAGEGCGAAAAAGSGGGESGGVAGEAPAGVSGEALGGGGNASERTWEG